MEAHLIIGRGCFSSRSGEVGNRLRMSGSSSEWSGCRNPNLDTSESPLSPASESGETGLDGMELDAALALSRFSQTAELESDGRSRKRIKSVSSAMDLTFVVPEDTQATSATNEEKIKLEQTLERPQAIRHCSSNDPSLSSGKKTKQNLTQAERDAKRLHRVLANRESARQTIRRRQAFRDELAKKVSVLSVENHNMKMEKEQIMKECMLLRRRNKELKDKMAMAIQRNIMDAATTSFSQQPPLLVNIKLPFMPGVWPPGPVTAAHPGLFYEEDDTVKPAAEPKLLLYVPPSSLFCSLLHRMSNATAIENERERSAIHELACSKEKAATCMLDIDLNCKTEVCEPPFDAPVENAVSKPAPGAEVVQVFTDKAATFSDVGAAAAARRRRREIMKLKHHCGRPISIRN